MPRKKPGAKIEFLANKKIPKKRKKAVKASPTQRSVEEILGERGMLATPEIRMTCATTPELWAFIIQILHRQARQATLEARAQFNIRLNNHIEQGSDLVIRIQSPFLAGFEDDQDAYELEYLNPNPDPNAYRRVVCSSLFTLDDDDLSHVFGTCPEYQLSLVLE